jgi:hypothetical protein
MLFLEAEVTTNQLPFNYTRYQSHLQIPRVCGLDSNPTHSEKYTPAVVKLLLLVNEFGYLVTSKHHCIY